MSDCQLLEQRSDSTCQAMRLDRSVQKYATYVQEKVEQHRCTLLAALQTSSSHLQGGLAKRSEESCATGRCQRSAHAQSTKDPYFDDGFGDDGSTEGSEDDIREMFAFAVNLLSEPFGCGHGQPTGLSRDFHFAKSLVDSASFLQSSPLVCTSSIAERANSPGARSDARNSQALSTGYRSAFAGSSCSSRKRKPPPDIFDLQTPHQSAAGTDPFASPAGSSQTGTSIFMSCRGQPEFSDAAAESAFSVASEAVANDAGETAADVRSPFHLSIGSAHAHGLRFGLAGSKPHPEQVNHRADVRVTDRAHQLETSRVELPWNTQHGNVPPSTKAEQACTSQAQCDGPAADGVQIVNLRDLKQHDLNLLDEGMFAQRCRGSAADFNGKMAAGVSTEGRQGSHAPAGGEGDLNTAITEQSMSPKASVNAHGQFEYTFSKFDSLPAIQRLDDQTEGPDASMQTAVLDKQMVGTSPCTQLNESGVHHDAVGSPGTRSTTLKHINALNRIVHSESPSISTEARIFRSESPSISTEASKPSNANAGAAIESSGILGSQETRIASEASNHDDPCRVAGMLLSLAACQMDGTPESGAQPGSRSIQEDRPEGASRARTTAANSSIGSQAHMSSATVHPTASSGLPAKVGVSDVRSATEANNEAFGPRDSLQQDGYGTRLPAFGMTTESANSGTHQLGNPQIHTSSFEGVGVEATTSSRSCATASVTDYAKGHELGIKGNAQFFKSPSFNEEPVAPPSAQDGSSKAAISVAGHVQEAQVQDMVQVFTSRNANHESLAAPRSHDGISRLATAVQPDLLNLTFGGDGLRACVQSALDHAHRSADSSASASAAQPARLHVLETPRAESGIADKSRSCSRKSSSDAVTVTPKRSRSAETDNRISKLRNSPPCLPRYEAGYGSPRHRPPRTPRGSEATSGFAPRAWSEDSSSTNRSTRGRLPLARTLPGFQRRARSREGGQQVKRQMTEDGNPGLPADALGQQARPGFGMLLQQSTAPCKPTEQESSPKKGSPPTKPPTLPPGKGTPPSPPVRKGSPSPPPRKGKGTPPAKGTPPSPPPTKGKGTPPSPGPGKGSPPQKGPPPKGKGKGKPPMNTGLAAQKKAEPRKPDVIPGVKVKKLHWNSFRLDDTIDFRSTVWNELDVQGANIDTRELEALFADEPPGGRRSMSMQSSAPVKKIQVLEAQRRRQICVMLARLPDMRDTHDAVLNMDKSRLNREQVELLLINLPGQEEVKLMRNAQTEHATDEFTVWDTAEEFVFTMMSVPKFELRLQVWDFENSFHDSSQAIAKGESSLSLACDTLLTSGSIRHLLTIVLFVGNFLNGGTPRGRADGFAIEALAQMRTVKMSQAERGQADRPGTLVDYLVRQMEKQHPGELEEMAAAGDAMDFVKTAARYKLGDVKEEMLALKRKCEQLLQRVRQSGAPADELSAEEEVFRQHLEILSSYDAEIQELHSRFEKLEDKYGELCAWFHVANKKSKMSTDEFFGIWDKFFTDINQSRKALVEEERKQAKAQARQEARNASLQRLPRNSDPNAIRAIARNSARSSSVMQRRKTTGGLGGNAEEGAVHPRSKSGTPATRGAPPIRSITKRRTLSDLHGLFNPETMD